MKLGLSGNLANGFIRSPLTPLFLLAALGLGLIALLTIPREEEPQISVPMIDIMVRADGLAAADAVELITEPLEAIISGIAEVEHTYSNTMDDQVLVTARFKVGVAEDLAVLRVHEEIRGHYDQLPLGVPEPLIIARGINDVPILTLTLSPGTGAWRTLDGRVAADIGRRAAIAADLGGRIGLEFHRRRTRRSGAHRARS
jgi:multidrug efflux pump subunit AcrB